MEEYREKMSKAFADMKEAEDRYIEAVKEAFPIGTRVIAGVHHRYNIDCEVVDYDHSCEPLRLVCINVKTRGVWKIVENQVRDRALPEEMTA